MNKLKFNLVSLCIIVILSSTSWAFVQAMPVETKLDVFDINNSTNDENEGSIKIDFDIEEEKLKELVYNIISSSKIYKGEAEHIPECGDLALGLAKQILNKRIIKDGLQKAALKTAENLVALLPEGIVKKFLEIIFEALEIKEWIDDLIGEFFPKPMRLVNEIESHTWCGGVGVRYEIVPKNGQLYLTILLRGDCARKWPVREPVQLDYFNVFGEYKLDPTINNDGEDVTITFVLPNNAKGIWTVEAYCNSDHTPPDEEEEADEEEEIVPDEFYTQADIDCWESCGNYLIWIENTKIDIEFEKKIVEGMEAYGDPKLKEARKDLIEVEKDYKETKAKLEKLEKDYTKANKILDKPITSGADTGQHEWALQLINDYPTARENWKKQIEELEQRLEQLQLFLELKLEERLEKIEILNEKLARYEKEYPECLKECIKSACENNQKFGKGMVYPFTEIEKLRKKLQDDVKKLLENENPCDKTRYKLTPEKMLWQEAEDYAVSIGGHLVAINSQEEQDFLVKEFGHTQLFWIGFTDKDTEGNWKWTSDEQSSYTNWYPRDREPNNVNGGEHFAVMNWSKDSHPELSKESGYWNDLGTGSPEWIPYYGIVELPGEENADQRSLAQDQLGNTYTQEARYPNETMSFINPARGDVTIHLTNIEQANSSLIIFNQYGVKIFEHRMEQVADRSYLTIPSTVFSNGIYFVTIHTGGRLVTKKLVYTR